MPVNFKIHVAIIRNLTQTAKNAKEYMAQSTNK